MDKYTAMSISAQVHPSFLKTMPDTCDKYALNVANQLTAHRNKQLGQQKAHEQRIARMMQSHEAHITSMLKSYEEEITRVLTRRQGIWLSNSWAKILFVFLAVYSILVFLYVKFRY